jgi:hypothetical protein
MQAELTEAATPVAREAALRKPADKSEAVALLTPMPALNQEPSANPDNAAPKRRPTGADSMVQVSKLTYVEIEAATMSAQPPLPGRIIYAQMVHQDPSYGAVSVTTEARLAAGVSLSNMGRPIPPEFAFNFERLHALMRDAGWASLPPDSRVAYAFDLSEVSEISNFKQIEGIQIPGMEEQLARIFVISPARFGADPIPVSCTIQFVPVSNR